MLPYFNKTAYGNPTLTHKPGWEAFEVIMNSFQKISTLHGSKNPRRNHLHAKRNRSQQPSHHGLSCFAQKGKGKKIVISEIEPINVLQVAEMMGKFGFINHQNPSRPRRLHQPRKTQRSRRQRNHTGQHFSRQQ